MINPQNQEYQTAFSSRNLTNVLAVSDEKGFVLYQHCLNLDLRISSALSSLGPEFCELHYAWQSANREWEHYVSEQSYLSGLNSRDLHHNTHEEKNSASFCTVAQFF